MRGVRVVAVGPVVAVVVEVGVALCVGVGVFVEVGVLLGSVVAVAVELGVAVGGVPVAVAVDVGVLVGVFVGVGVGVEVGDDAMSWVIRCRRSGNWVTPMSPGQEVGKSGEAIRRWPVIFSILIDRPASST